METDDVQNFVVRIVETTCQGCLDVLVVCAICMHCPIPENLEPTPPPTTQPSRSIQNT
jgi:hypothetical protein